MKNRLLFPNKEGEEGDDDEQSKLNALQRLLSSSLVSYSLSFSYSQIFSPLLSLSTVFLYDIQWISNSIRTVLCSVIHCFLSKEKSEEVTNLDLVLRSPDFLCHFPLFILIFWSNYFSEKWMEADVSLSRGSLSSSNEQSQGWRKESDEKWKKIETVHNELTETLIRWIGAESGVREKWWSFEELQRRCPPYLLVVVKVHCNVDDENHDHNFITERL